MGVSHSSIQSPTPVDAAHPTAGDPPAGRRLSLSLFFFSSFRGFRCVAHFPPFPPPTHPVSRLSPQKTPQPPLIFFLVSTSLLDTFEHAGRGRKGTKQQAAPGSPPSPFPSSPPIDADRGRLLAGDADRSPGGALLPYVSRRLLPPVHGLFRPVACLASGSGRSAGGWIGLSSWVRGPGG